MFGPRNPLGLRRSRSESRARNFWGTRRNRNECSGSTTGRNSEKLMLILEPESHGARNRTEATGCFTELWRPLESDSPWGAQRNCTERSGLRNFSGCSGAKPVGRVATCPDSRVACNETVKSPRVTTPWCARLDCNEPRGPKAMGLGGTSDVGPDCRGALNETATNARTRKPWSR